MASDLIVPELTFGITIPIEIRDDDGKLDDLSVYTIVRMVIGEIDFSANVQNKTLGDAELALGTTGILNWSPTSMNKTPAFGKYFLEVFREAANVNKPIKKFTLECTREATKA